MTVKKIALIVLAIVVAPIALLAVAFAMMAFMFSVVPATLFATADVVISIKDSNGQPVKNSTVELWKYEYANLIARTDENGMATFPKQNFQYGKNIYMFWVNRPASFEIRVHVPEISPQYYRFELVGSGPQEYDVFNTEYDYFHGEEWVGRFDGNQRVKSTIHSMGKEYSAVMPQTENRQVQLWNATAKIQSNEPPLPAFEIRLDLIQSRQWSPDEK